MNILILHRYFWPQSYPYAQMLKDIVETISSKHTVSVLTTDSGSINERESRQAWSLKQKIKVDALPLGSEKRANVVKKAANSLYFGLWLIYKLFISKADVVMVATTPPIVIAMIVRWVSFIKKTKYIYHCQDIHPEAMLLGGNLKEGFLYKILLNIDKKNINFAWKVITLSNDMERTLKERGCKTSHINIINNFIFESSNKTSLTNKPNKKIQFLFAGSLGRLQNLPLLMDSIKLLKHRDDIQFTFMGDGLMYKEMTLCKNENSLNNVEFLGQRSLEEAVDAMRYADIGIVSIGANISNVAYPSKTMMYLGNGLPILALVDKDTDIYKFINSKNLGKAIPPTTAKEIAKSICLFIDDLKQSPLDKHYIKTVAENTFSKNIILPKFLDLYCDE